VIYIEGIIKVIMAFLDPACSDPGTKSISFEIKIERSKKEGKFVVSSTRITNVEFFLPG